jgi:cysteine synthase A
VDGFVCAAGTGGTIGGISAYLKSVNPRLLVYLIDPPGSSLHSYVTTGRLAHSAGRSVAEGIGIGRLTANFKAGVVDGAFLGRCVCELRLEYHPLAATHTRTHPSSSPPQPSRHSDDDALDMAYFLLENEGLFVGPSAALNVVGAVRLALMLGPGHTVVTVSGWRGEGRAVVV